MCSFLALCSSRDFMVALVVVVRRRSVNGRLWRKN